MKGSWKTTVAGTAAILAAISTAAYAMLDADPETNPNWGEVSAQIAIGIGLLKARDWNVSSEQEGLK